MTPLRWMIAAAVGLTLVYGVLHIINFDHGAILGAAMFAAYVAFQLGLDPYVAMVPLAGVFYGLGYGVQKLIIGRDLLREACA